MERLRGCFSGYGGHIFTSKADRIMSRYRPIAPKPAMPCISEVERSASSAVTLDNLCIRQIPGAPSTSMTSKQKSRRVRKRPSKDSERHPQPAKRLALVTPNQFPEKPQSWSAAGCVSVSGEVVLTPNHEDEGFMERAAASAPPSVLPLERLGSKAIHNSSYAYGGCFTELIRGIAGLPTANHVHNLLQHQNQQQQHEHYPPSILNVFPQKSSMEQIGQSRQADPCVRREGSELPKDESCSDAFWPCATEVDHRDNIRERASSEDAQQSGLDEETIDGVSSENKGLVTLSLLPDVPMKADSPAFSTSSSDSAHASCHGMSLAGIEQVYGHSSEPAILTNDETQKLVWYNQAYCRACKEKSRLVAPFIDPLGLPTQMGHFQLRFESHGECVPVTLWGFLKKFVVDVVCNDEPSWFTQLSDALCSGENESKGVPVPYPTQQPSVGVNKYDQPLGSTTVITPQPVRLVGSVVSVENVSEIQDGNAMTGTLEMAKTELEEGSLPGLITDAFNIVRWVNTAYKVMVGQPECPWLASTMKEEGGASPTIAGEVLLSCNVEVPTTASSFSGRANVQWTRNTGERTCMTLPCDVSALADGSSRRMLVWTFDIQASLSLSCGLA